MKCIAINLESQPERRAAVEASFYAVPHSGWELVVLPAISAEEAKHFPGATTAAEKGCFLSHRCALESSLTDNEPVWIVEDDVIFSRHAFLTATKAINYSNADILFTNVAATAPNDPLLLLAALPPTENEIRLLDLKGVMFAGTVSYLVPAEAKRRLWTILQNFSELAKPYDVLLRGLVRADAFAAAVTLPFLTGLSEHSKDSQIRRETSFRDRVWNAMRQLLYVDADLKDCRFEADEIERTIRDQRALIMGRLLGVRMATDFRDAQ